jgi:hypothetical protein
MNDLLSQALFKILLYDLTKPAGREASSPARDEASKEPAAPGGDKPGDKPFSAKARRDKRIAAPRRGQTKRVGRRRRWGARKLLAATVVAFLAGIGLGQLQKAVDRSGQLLDEQPQPPRRLEPARMTVASQIVVRPSSQTPLRVQIEPAGAMPKNSILHVRGLPPGISFSEGFATASGAWIIPPARLAGLTMNVAAVVPGSFTITFELAGDSGPLAKAQTQVVIGPEPAQTGVVPPLLEMPAPGVAAAHAPSDSNTLPQATIHSPLERLRAERMIARGERNIEAGNIALARQLFLRAADAGLARGALLLATTYDARELSRLHISGVQPNPALARQWYERARQLGAPEAEGRLVGLGME